MAQSDKYTPRRPQIDNEEELKKNADVFLKEKLSFDDKWLSDKADAALVEFAENAGNYMAYNKLTKTKIRSIYSEIIRIQMNTFEKEKSSFYLLKPKVAYALAREPKNDGLKLFKLIFDKSWDKINDEKSYKNFCNLIEAILAYHKVYENIYK